MAKRILSLELKVKIPAYRIRKMTARDGKGPVAGMDEVVAPAAGSRTEVSVGETDSKKKFSPHALRCANEAAILILSSLNNPLTIGQLAKKVGLNSRTLQDCFKSVHGKSIFAFGQHARLEYGKKLLLDPDVTIQEVAEACGYPEQSNFGAAFKRKYSVGPGEWRKGLAD